MKVVAAFLFCCAMQWPALAAPPAFARAELLDEGASLNLHRDDGSSSPAPLLEDQDAFDKPAVARNGKYVGWLALYPDRGASYLQPIYLVVTDGANRINRFRSNFGMVFGWCFTPDSQAVVFESAFPHGMTPNALEMRRIDDGKLLRRFDLDPVGPDEAQEDVLLAKAPKWAMCAVKSVREPWRVP
jgi:hypothetical protein